MNCSFVELYNEKFYDLLENNGNNNNLKLKLVENKFIIEGASEIPVEYPSDIFKVSILNRLLLHWK